MAQQTATPTAFAAKLAQTDLPKTGPSIPNNDATVVVHVLPENLDAVDALAADHGLKRVDDELDRRTYEPA